MKTEHLFLLAVALLTACHDTSQESDAYGNFEATEILVSAQANGPLNAFSVEEGQVAKANTVVGYVDTLQLSLKKAQLQASKATIEAKTASVLAQIRVLQEQRRVLKREQLRTENLLRDKAATPKQLDDINGQIRVIDQQIRSVETQNMPVLSELRVLDTQIKQVEDQIAHSIIRNPIDGQVLVTYAHADEVTTFGKPLYKVANLNEMILRVYVSGSQVPHLKVGQPITVRVDATESENRELPGEVAWIASTAEFTPKIVQTKEERVNLVYAVKVRVKNDGTLKIGMPGEVKFSATEKPVAIR